MYFLLFSADVVDFAKPSGSHSTHPKLFHWVKTYFQDGKQNKSSPLVVSSGEPSTQQGSSQSNSMMSCALKGCNTVDVDCLNDIDSKVPATKKRKLEGDKSKMHLVKTYRKVTYFQGDKILRICLKLKFLWTNFQR